MNAERHIYHCPNCRLASDAMRATVCRCISQKPSPVCASCGNCWCSAPMSTQTRLWLAAPLSLRARLDGERALREQLRQRTAAGAPLVLIVDDDEEIREIAAEAIGELGYSTIAVDSATAALDVVEHERPDVVITDALMPRLDGRELCRLIKGGFKGTRVVIMTALYTAPHYKYEAFRDFKDDEYLPKPIDFVRLRDVLARLAPLAA